MIVALARRLRQDVPANRPSLYPPVAADWGGRVPVVQSRWHRTAGFVHPIAAAVGLSAQ